MANTLDGRATDWIITYKDGGDIKTMTFTGNVSEREQIVQEFRKLYSYCEIIEMLSPDRLPTECWFG